PLRRRQRPRSLAFNREILEFFARQKKLLSFHRPPGRNGTRHNTADEMERRQRKIRQAQESRQRRERTIRKPAEERFGEQLEAHIINRKRSDADDQVTRDSEVSHEFLRR